jgi:hypothetical protein
MKTPQHERQHLSRHPGKQARQGAGSIADDGFSTLAGA